MKISEKISKFQDGGAVPAPQGGAPAGGPGGAPAEAQDPIMQIAELAMQALETQDCQASMAVCEAFISMLQGAPGGGAEQGGAPAEQGAPVFKRGGKLVSRK